MNATRLSSAGVNVRLVLVLASLIAVAWGGDLFATYHEAVYWNLGHGSHLYYYVHPVLYVLTLGAAIGGVNGAMRSVGAYGTARGWVMNTVLSVLLVLTLWACVSTLLARAYLD